MTAQPITRVLARRRARTANRARWLAWLVLLAGALMDLLDGTILNVALPSIRADLHATESALEWIASAYLLAFALTLIAAGRLGDRLGRKRLFLAGVALFGLASLFAGLTQDPAQLIAARIVQGLAAGVMVPQVLATARSIFAARELRAVFAMYGAVGGGAVALGLVLSGLLMHANVLGLGWRAVFLVNVPVAALVFAAGGALIPETRDASTPRPDLAGTVLLGAGLVAFIYPLLEGRSLGWPTSLWPVLGAGVLMLALFALLERRHQDDAIAVLPGALVRSRAFLAGLLIQLLVAGSMTGLFFVLTIWLQSGEGFSPIASGLTAVSFCAGMIAFARLPESLAPRLGRNVLVVGGLLTAAGSTVTALSAVLGPTPMLGWVLAPGLAMTGAGFALVVIPLGSVVMLSVPPQVAGSAAGVQGTVQQLGGVLGIGIVAEAFFATLPGSGFRGAFETALAIVVLGFLATAALVPALPKASVGEAYG